MSNNPGSRVTATGLAVMLLAVSVGVGSGDIAVLLGLVGILIGANLVAVGVWMGVDQPTTTHTGPAALADVGALFLRRGLPVAGTILASSAVTAVAACETGPVLGCAMLTVLLIGLCLINIPFVLGE